MWWKKLYTFDMERVFKRLNRKITVNGYDRHYCLCSRDGGPQRGLPVVLMLHGAGDTARGAMRQTNWAEKAAAENFIAVFPDALRPHMDKTAAFEANPQIWNDDSDRGWSYQHKVSDVDFIAALVEDLKATFAVNAKQIFLTGFSNGAGMVFCAAAALPDKFAAIAPVAGHCWSKSTLKFPRPVPLLYIVGGADRLNPVKGGEIVVPWGSVLKPPVEDTFRKWAGFCGCDGKPVRQWLEGAVTRKEFGLCPGGALIEYYEIAGMGHHWPGGHNFLPEAVAGHEITGLDATALIWSFFAKTVSLMESK